MLGVPASLGAFGWALIAIGLVLAIAALVRFRGGLRRQVPSVAAALVALIIVGAATPYIVWSDAGSPAAARNSQFRHAAASSV